LGRGSRAAGGGVSPAATAARPLRDALGLLHALVLEDGRRWGDAELPWQREDAEPVLDQQSPAPCSLLTRGRRGAKTSDLAGIAVAAMLTQAPAGARLYATAEERDQASLFADSISGLKFRTPELRDATVDEVAAISALDQGGGAAADTDQVGVGG
jgi:hypothetical protein